MSAPAFVERPARLGLRVAAAFAFLPPLLTRITLGHAFFLTVRGKLANFDTFVSFLTDQGVPAPVLNAHIVARLEFYGGILLVLGLLTRLVALGLAGTMVVALLTERKQFFESWRVTGDSGPPDISFFVVLLLLTRPLGYRPRGGRLAGRAPPAVGLG